MPTVTLNGPVVRSGVHNVVLRSALLHSPTERLVGSDDFHKIQVGIREGAFTSIIGTWDQSSQSIKAATPQSVLNDGVSDKRLRSGQAIVVIITTTGAPASLEGSRINFQLARVGGRDGTAKPLVAAGAAVSEPNARTAIATLERQVNTIAQWEESVKLQDPVVLAPTGSFQGRLQVDSTTQISLQRYTGNWVEVNGDAVGITSDGLTRLSTDAMVESTGIVGSTAPSASTLYYVYVGTVDDSAQVRLSATAPTAYLGSKYLGTGPVQTDWRFCGWVYMDGSTQFVDNTANRHLANFYNRIRKDLLLQPAYSDDNAITTWATTSTAWTPANSGTGATCSYIANGEDAVAFKAHAGVANSGNNISAVGISTTDSTTSAEVSAETVGNATFQNISCSWNEVPSEGRRTTSLLVFVSAGTGTYRADRGRDGSATDVRNTYLVGSVFA